MEKLISAIVGIVLLLTLVAGADAALALNDGRVETVVKQLVK